MIGHWLTECHQYVIVRWARADDMSRRPAPPEIPDIILLKRSIAPLSKYSFQYSRWKASWNSNQINFIQPIARMDQAIAGRLKTINFKRSTFHVGREAGDLRGARIRHRRIAPAQEQKPHVHASSQ